MKPESLHALLIDRQLGELSPDTVELLDAWLAEHPECAAAVSAVRQTLDTTNTAVRRFPELARPEVNVIGFPARSFPLIPLAWAASILILLGGTAWLGFRAGQESTHTSIANQEAESAAGPAMRTAAPDDPWARYALASDPQGGLTVVRRNSNSQP